MAQVWSSGTIGSFKLAGGWCLAALLAVGIVTHADEFRAMLMSAHSSDALESDPRHTAARPTVASRRTSDRTVQIRANASGHYETRALVNGRSIDVMVDTGATVVALSYEDARAAGIYVGAGEYKHVVNTANGQVKVAAVVLDSVEIDDIRVDNVRAIVAQPGKQHTTLLGMSFLNRLAKAEMSRGVLLLQQD